MVSSSMESSDVVLKMVQEQICSLYDIHKPFYVSLLKYSENYTFFLEYGDNKRIIRVNRPGYHTLEELQAEVIWMDILKRDTDIILPEVFAGINNSLVQELNGEVCYYCSMFSYMSGTAAGKLKENELLKNLEGIGEISAVMHLHSIRNRTSLKRFEWNYDTFFGEEKRWGEWYRYNGLSESMLNIINEVLKIIKIKLKIFGKSSEKYGLIHSDLHLSNVIIGNNNLQIIDFDDCGYSWFLYDIACTLVEYSDGLEQMLSALLIGYERKRKLSDEEKEILPSFILMRRIIRLAWLSSHSDSDTAKSVGSDYLKVTIDMCENYLKSDI